MSAEFKVEYAASGRSKCHITKQPIAQGALRIGKMVQAPNFDGMIPQWYSWTAFKKDKAKVEELRTNCSKMSGLEKLRWEDQQKVKELMGKNDSAPANEDEAKKLKELEEESTALWQLKDKLSKFLSVSEMKDLLALNGQDSSGGEQKLLERLVDGMWFGALPNCPNKECNGPFLYWSSSSGKYKCSGSLPWAKCSYEVEPDKVERKDWEIGSTKVAFLKKFTFVKHSKLHYVTKQDSASEANDAASSSSTTPATPASATPSTPASAISTTPSTDATIAVNATSDPVVSDPKDVSPVPSADSAVAAATTSTTTTTEKGKKEEEKKEDKPLFHDLTFACSGKLSMTQTALGEIIDAHGGLFSSSVTKGVDYVISTESDFKSNGNKIKAAKKLKITVVTEDFIHKSVELKHLPTESEEKDLLIWKPASTSRSRGSKRTISQLDDDDDDDDDSSTTDAKSTTTDASSSAPSTSEEEPPAKKKKTTLKLKVKGRAAVDPDFPEAEDYHVLESGKDVFSVMLNMADISRGTNSYYMMQVLEHDKQSGKYVLFRKWGRVGTDIGSNKVQHFSSSPPAVQDFKKLFAEKTGNTWERRDSFVKQPRLFYPVEIDYGNESNNKIDELLKGGQSGEYKGKLHPKVRDLTSFLFDVTAMQKVLLEMEIDIKKMPLGKLSKKTINDGYRALTEIQTVLNSSNPERSQLLSLTNKFFTIIPHDFGTSNPPLIETAELLKEKVQLLDALNDMEIATSLLNSDGSSEEDPLDEHYKKLATDIEWVDPNTDEFKRLQTYMLNTHAETHAWYTLELLELYRVSRHGEAERFKNSQDIGNRQLLWHGSGRTNFVGILSQGLRIAPPEAPSTGYMFGKGIYFANMASKSANYCRTSADNPIGVMLLSEVALGKMNELTNAQYMDKPPKGTDSTKGCGKTTPNPDDYFTTEDGVIIPMGKGVQSKVKNSSLLYDEFIVYNVNQVHIRYLLKIKFNYRNNRGLW